MANASNVSNAFSSIGLYSRRDNQAVVSVINSADSEPLNMSLLQLLRNTEEERSGDEDFLSPWSVHSPVCRTVFQELKSKLSDLDAIYKNAASVDTHTHHVIPTADVIEQKEKLDAVISFFKSKLTQHFEQFVKFQEQCEREQSFMVQCSSLLQLFEQAPIDDAEFNKCSKKISETLAEFTTHLSNSSTESAGKRDFYWQQFRDIREQCKLVGEVQADNICSICMANEVDVALNPCGHTFCGRCMARIASCPNCRKPVSQKLRLFY